MRRYYIETTDIKRMVDAKNWGIEGSFLVFYGAENYKVLAVKADTVKEITLQPADKE